MIHTLYLLFFIFCPFGLFPNSTGQKNWQEMGSMRKISDGSKWWMKESESKKKIAHGGFPAANNTPRWRLKMAKTQTRRSTNCTANSRPSWKVWANNPWLEHQWQMRLLFRYTAGCGIKKGHMLLYYPLEKPPTVIINASNWPFKARCSFMMKKCIDVLKKKNDVFPNWKLVVNNDLALEII